MVGQRRGRRPSARQRAGGDAELAAAAMRGRAAADGRLAATGRARTAPARESRPTERPPDAPRRARRAPAEHGVRGAGGDGPALGARSTAARPPVRRAGVGRAWPALRARPEWSRWASSA